jgi:hypothetical protein
MVQERKINTNEDLYYSDEDNENATEGFMEEVIIELGLIVI